MNLQSIKEEFKEYYISQLQNSGQDASPYNSETSSISIFQHKDEFKNFLKTKYDADNEMLSRSLSDIMKMDVEDGKLVDNRASKRKKENDELMKDLINEALNDENVKAALDIDESEDLDSEEIAIFLQNIQGTSDENDSSKNISFDDLAQGIEDIYSGEYQKQDVVLNDETLEGEEATDALLGELFLNKKAFAALDEDEDGILSLEEQEKFKEYIKNYDGYNDAISQADIKSAYYDILEGDFSYDNKLDFDNSTKEVVDKAKDTKTYSAKASNTSISTPRNTYGQSRTSNTASVREKTIENMTLSELQSKKTEKEQEVQEAQTALNKIYSLENEAIKTAQGTLDDAKKEYDKALNSEIENNPELKQLYLPLKTTISQIDLTQKSINETELEITKTQSELTSQNSTLDADRSNLQALRLSKSTLESKTSTNDEEKAQIEQKIKELEEKIKDAQKKVEDDEKAIEETKKKLEELQNGENGLSKLQENLEKLYSSKEEQEKNIDSIISETTKQAKEAYDKALENYDNIKTQETQKAKETLETKQKELDEINKQINVKQASKTQKENGVSSYDFNFETNLTANQEADLEKFKQNYEQNIDKYKKVEDATGVPAELIAAIHWRESTGNFNTYLHNGQQLGKVTTIVPKGIYFEDWTEAAIDAIKTHTPKDFDANDINSIYDFAEQYNGTGYKKRGVNTPYVWSGTTKYTSGKFVADHQYDPNAIDKQLGVAVMMQSICA